MNFGSQNVWFIILDILLCFGSNNVAMKEKKPLASGAA
jgi:hypothetical protein